jgi:hypothetical protein
VTDGTAEFNASFRRNVGFFYDLVKGSIDRVVKGLNVELGDLPVFALGVTPGWLRSERMLDEFGVREDNWREACQETPGFAISESPTYIGRGVAALAADPEARRFAGQILTARQLADTYDFTDNDGSRPDCWGFVDTYGIDYEGSDGIDDFR